VFGKEDTLITIQIDQMLAKQFGMEYVDKDGVKKNPYIIHRTSIGCYERTLALLIEKYAGAFPVWLAPVQVKVIPISEKQADKAQEIKEKLVAAKIRVEADLRNQKLGYKIRQAQMEKIPYMLVIGEKEIENNVVAVRTREGGDMGTMSLDDFIHQVNVTDSVYNVKID
jgi:threonyl-tRNA synthetase